MRTRRLGVVISGMLSAITVAVAQQRQQVIGAVGLHQRQACHGDAVVAVVADRQKVRLRQQIANVLVVHLWQPRNFRPFSVLFQFLFRKLELSKVNPSLPY